MPVRGNNTCRIYTVTIVFVVYVKLIKIALVPVLQWLASVADMVMSSGATTGVPP